jgi:hypothetical protein
MGMKEIFIRTDEENIQHKQLVDRNRQRRELLKQKQQEKLLVIPQVKINFDYFLILSLIFFYSLFYRIMHSYVNQIGVICQILFQLMIHIVLKHMFNNVQRCFLMKQDHIHMKLCL